jgi:hypothetical protein
MRSITWRAIHVRLYAPAAGAPASAARFDMSEAVAKKLSIDSLYKGLRYGTVLVPRQGGC